MKTRRTFIDALGRAGLASTFAPWLPGCGTVPSVPAVPAEHYDLVVIGTGFGGSLSALWVTHRLNERAGNPSTPAPAPLRILMLERGTWWTTPTETVTDKQVKTRDFLIDRGQPTQEWSTLGDARGMMDLLKRCRRSDKRPQGLFDFLPIGKRGLFNLHNDGVSVLRASGVGGGSLVYSKILLRPPETLFDDPRWPAPWRGAAGSGVRNRLYGQAVRGVTVGVETLTMQKDTPTGLTGPSQILMRSPGMTPASVGVAPPTLMRIEPNRVVWQIRIAPDRRPQLNEREGELIDRARVFQTAMSDLTSNYGTVNLSINDMDFTPPPSSRLNRAELELASEQKKLRDASPTQTTPNYCERHGRCNIGCLPGAGQTLNRQLMRAIYGKVKVATLDRKVPSSGDCLVNAVALQLTAFAEADLLSEREGGGYLVHFRRHRLDDPSGPGDAIVVSADRVIVAAGSLGTTELMLRSQQRAAATNGALGLRGLSERVGDGFSPNGDHLAFLPETKERINLTYGPVTTSYAQFKADAPRAHGFHQIEDQGMPRALGALTGHGVPIIQALASGDGSDRYVAALGEALKAAQAIFDRTSSRGYAKRGVGDISTDRGEAEDELTSYVMCVAAQGKDDANGCLRLEDDRLRLSRPDGKRFHEDPIYGEIHATLGRLAEKLRADGSQATFLGPMSDVKIPFASRSVLTSHPLGGCAMGETIASGVVDAWGRVFRQPAAGGGFHRGLYIADGSIVPTALGVNPSLTISALALGVAERVLAEWDQIPTRAQRVPTALQCGAASAAA